MEITFLGTGTSYGVPVIGCRCAVCTSTDARNRRTRSSLLVQHADNYILIDAATELRLQAVAAGLSRVDALLFTHAHADHVHGLDDVRRFNELQGRAIPCYGNANTVWELRRCFWYVFEETQLGGGKPQLELYPLDGPFSLGGLRIVPIPVWHGRIPVLGYRLNNVAYVTDCSEIPPSSLALLEGLDVLILDALRYRPHPTHFHLEQAIATAKQLRPQRTYFTHICHDLDHATVNAQLPQEMTLAYDGLKLESVGITPERSLDRG